MILNEDYHIEKKSDCGRGGTFERKPAVIYDINPTPVQIVVKEEAEYGK